MDFDDDKITDVLSPAVTHGSTREWAPNMIGIIRQATEADSTSSDLNEQLVALLVFAALALLLFSFIYLRQNTLSRGARTSDGLVNPETSKTSHFNVTFARLYGLLTVAALGVALAFADITSEAQTAAFTLLGTIAGYLAGARPTTTETTTTPSPDSPESTHVTARHFTL